MTTDRLILFVAGDAPRSRRARANLDSALADLGDGGVDREEIDLMREPERTLEFGIFATPALAVATPHGAVSLLYGDLSDRQRLRQFLREHGASDAD